MFQHIIFISLDNSIFPLRNELTLFFYHSLYPSYGLLCSTDLLFLQKMTKNVFLNQQKVLGKSLCSLRHLVVTLYMSKLGSVCSKVLMSYAVSKFS